MKDPYHVIQTVLVTEKGTELADMLNKFTFRVARDCNKIEIKEAVEALFDVKVASVNVMNRKGKRKRMRRLTYGRRADWKRAIVTLSEGYIDII